MTLTSEISSIPAPAGGGPKEPDKEIEYLVRRHPGNVSNSLLEDLTDYELTSKDLVAFCLKGFGPSSETTGMAKRESSRDVHSDPIA
jgi:hypothetical protein